MKSLFIKFKHVKKRRTVKKTIWLIVAAWNFRFSSINSDTLPTDGDFGHYTPRLQIPNSDKKTQIDDQSVNYIRVKTGSGAMIEIQNQHNQTLEALKSALEIRCGEFNKSGPGTRAKADTRKGVNNRSPKGAKSKSGGGGFTEALLSDNPSRSRPAVANGLAQQFQTNPSKGGNGLFGRGSARSNIDSYNLGCASGPRSITVIAGQRDSNLAPSYFEKVKFNDGYEAEVRNSQLDHILVKHGHPWGVEDIDVRTTEEANANLATGRPKQIRTRPTRENREIVRASLHEMASRSELELYPNYAISGEMGRAYFCSETKLFIGIDKNNLI